MENKKDVFSIHNFVLELSSQKEQNILTFIAGILLFFTTILTFIKNYKYNDNHLNWLNHDYSKNLLMCTEENSIFMTEGGDNQVFGSLYFTYAEKLRPDISPYDQKGNIFKRIYGDMRYIDPQTLERRMQLVDTHLFAGEEPFYENERDRKDPYFIPYWQGRRPVYLTWERPRPWTLDATYFQDFARKLPENYVKELGLGEYYYKRYGIMYKVQDIRYKLVDYLEVKKTVTLQQAQKLFSDWLHRPVDISFTMGKVKLLEKEGLIKIRGNEVEFVKTYPYPFTEDFFSNLLFRWKNIPNAEYLDVLSREIIVNYGYMLGEFYREKVNELLELKKDEKNPAIIKDIDSKIKENWENAKKYYAEAIRYGYDSLSVLHNIGIVYMKNEIEDLSSKSRELFKNALKYYPNSFGTYSVMFAFLITDSFKNPSHESENLKEFEQYLNQLKNVLTRYRSSEGVYNKHPLWKNFEGLERFYEDMKQLPTSQLNNMIQLAENQIKSGQIDKNFLQGITTKLYFRGLNFGYEPYINKASEFTKVLLTRYENDRETMEWAFLIFLQSQKFDNAYEIGKRIQSKNLAFSNPVFYYYLGAISFQKGDKKLAKEMLSKFIQQASTDRKNIVQLRPLIEEANKILSFIK